MEILKAEIFSLYPEIIFGLSTKNEKLYKPPFYFNLSHTVGDDKEVVEKNRADFFNHLGLNKNSVALQRQIHSDIISYVTEGGVIGESDAMITDRTGLGLAISIADCVGIFLYDAKKKIIAGVHSDWRGTVKNILSKTLTKLVDDFNCKTSNMVAYISPSISQKNYEVGKEVAEHFHPNYLEKAGDKFKLNVARVNYDLLINAGVKEENIEVSSLCTFDSENLLHSYRRDGDKSGRALGVIAIKQ